MADSNTIKGQQTAYERWEMKSFSEDEQPERRVRKEDVAESERIAKLYNSVKKEAYSKGYTKGIQDGFAVGMENAQKLVETERQGLQNLLASFQKALETADEHIADDILSLVLDIAQAMIKTKLQVDRSAVLPIVMDAIHYLPHIEKPARIIVHHEDAQLLREYLAEELSDDQWQVQEDVSIERGGCLVETGANQIDATNEVRWKRVSEAFSKNTQWYQS